MTQRTKDKNVDEVINKFISRSEVGYLKYGTTTERTDIDFIGWLTHTQEELMDACIYIQRLINEHKKNREINMEAFNKAFINQSETHKLVIKGRILQYLNEVFNLENQTK